MPDTGKLRARPRIDVNLEGMEKGRGAVVASARRTLNQIECLSLTVIKHNENKCHTRETQIMGRRTIDGYPN